MPEVNWLAVIVAAATSFLLGGLWYGKPLFHDAWMRESGAPARTDPKTGRHPAQVFGVSIALSLVMAFVFAWSLHPEPPLDYALRHGAAVGGAVAACFGINYAFAGRSAKLWAIDGGYHFVQFMLYALVLGLWH
jgi:hypothetical protein